VSSDGRMSRPKALPTRASGCYAAAVAERGVQPKCPNCGATNWVSIETLAGGSRTFRLAHDGWVPASEDLDLIETVYRCQDCRSEPEAGSATWESLNDIPSA
jgi:predicted RNA-binding Zn-ribbon protein involved in translation (DUF1610 family)